MGRRFPHLASVQALACCAGLVLRFALMLGVVCGQGIVLARQSYADTAPASAAGGDYIIGPGDVLNVFVWRNPELSIPSLPVRPDGKISTPLVEDIVAVGKTTSQLAREMELVLQKYVRSPQVSIIVVNALSAARQVVVVGAVVKPLALPYREGLTVLDAMLAVDGVTEFAAGNRAKIVRQANGKRQELRVKLTRLLSKGDLTQNLPLQPGDVLVVPEGFF